MLLLLSSILTLLQLLAAGNPTSSPTSEIAYVGSGGCDGSDEGCVDDPEQEHVIQAMELLPDGSMKMLPDFAIPTGGMPVWLVPHITSDDKTCLFTTLADENVVAAYALNLLTGSHELIGKYASGGVAPVHGSVKHTDRGSVLLVANYHGPDDATSSDGASAASMNINPKNCSLALADSKPHNGSSVIPARQGGAHVHSFVASNIGQSYGYACDLGMDKIFVYEVQSDGNLVEASVVETKPGIGPRHSVETSTFLYVVNEMGQAVTAFSKGDDGSLSLEQTVSLVPDSGSAEGSKAAEIVGRFSAHNSVIYASNRGKLNSVTVFAVASDGSLSQAQQVEVPTFPRGMALAHSNSILLVAGQSKTEVVSFAVSADGTLTPSGHRLDASDGLPPHPATFAIFDAAPSSARMLRGPREAALLNVQVV